MSLKYVILLVCLFGGEKVYASSLVTDIPFCKAMNAALKDGGKFNAFETLYNAGDYDVDKVLWNVGTSAKKKNTIGTFLDLFFGKKKTSNRKRRAKEREMRERHENVYDLVAGKRSYTKLRELFALALSNVNDYDAFAAFFAAGTYDVDRIKVDPEVSKDTMGEALDKLKDSIQKEMLLALVYENRKNKTDDISPNVLFSKLFYKVLAKSTSYDDFARFYAAGTYNVDEILADPSTSPTKTIGEHLNESIEADSNSPIGKLAKLVNDGRDQGAPGQPIDPETKKTESSSYFTPKKVLFFVGTALAAYIGYVKLWKTDPERSPENAAEAA